MNSLDEGVCGDADNCEKRKKVRDSSCCSAHWILSCRDPRGRDPWSRDPRGRDPWSRDLRGRDLRAVYGPKNLVPGLYL